MIAKKPPVQCRADPDEVIDAVALLIQRAECKLIALETELAGAPEGSLAQLSGKMIESARWMTRRRTLIEVWELFTNQVWQSRLESE